MTLFIIDCAEVAPSPKYDCGIFRLTVAEDRTDEYAAALYTLGFRNVEVQP